MRNGAHSLHLIYSPSEPLKGTLPGNKEQGQGTYWLPWRLLDPLHSEASARLPSAQEVRAPREHSSQAESGSSMGEWFSLVSEGAATALQTLAQHSSSRWQRARPSLLQTPTSTAMIAALPPQEDTEHSSESVCCLIAFRDDCLALTTLRFLRMASKTAVLTLQLEASLRASAMPMPAHATKGHQRASRVSSSSARPPNTHHPQAGRCPPGKKKKMAQLEQALGLQAARDPALTSVVKLLCHPHMRGDALLVLP